MKTIKCHIVTDEAWLDRINIDSPPYIVLEVYCGALVLPGSLEAQSLEYADLYVAHGATWTHTSTADTNKILCQECVDKIPPLTYLKYASI